MFKITALLAICTVALHACQTNATTKQAPVDAAAAAVAPTPPPNATQNMAWIEGGEFTMGTDDKSSYEPERPAHPVKVHGFYMDTTEVTNKQFKTFVEATGYVTIAERKPDWEELKKQLPPGTPKPADELLVPGSLVFSPPSTPVSTDDISQWWQWTPGADWQHPKGPGSTLDGLWDHPVVHVAYDDAMAYAKWAGKRLPTEAEWEFAARGGLVEKRYAWGDQFKPHNRFMANTYQGSFPYRNTADDGYKGTAPVAIYPPNNYGLYDMIGNVWEWTSDYFDADAYKHIDKKVMQDNPQGPSATHTANMYAIERVTKGGSFLCAEDYCVNYRPSARRGTAYDSGASHIGFRCVKDKE
ncbi:formylglycine-generating enzyme required for sulfatase activity [Chitinophaga skermanii]|uniref:Formylglycine-generating enzyme required for sulfatase activity n=1 Tax=Chitinophaga skermanii TaxID=331697 RepID=A0A327QPN3_9BACT|nr:formylglycine-generating enzyme family protein [Chitinophaga skermanii]RAJ06586.1 formylglycine-generating enzyme required for sulfatase activity [Chitinophaga skermanii]